MAGLRLLFSRRDRHRSSSIADIALWRRTSPLRHERTLWSQNSLLCDVAKVGKKLSLQLRFRDTPSAPETLSALA